MDCRLATLDQLKPILKGFRLERGLTQEALAAQLGVTQQTYAQLEANPASASVERLFRVLRVLGVDLVLRDPVAATESAAHPRAAVTPAPPAKSAVKQPGKRYDATAKRARTPAAPAPVVKKREAW